MSPLFGRLRTFFPGSAPTEKHGVPRPVPPLFALIRTRIGTFGRRLARRTFRRRRFSPRGRIPVASWWRRRIAALFAAGFPTNKSGNNASTR